MSHSLNESMIGCWINPPVFLSKRRTLKETLRYYHDAKRVFIFKEIKKILKTKKRIKVLDFGSGHGGGAIHILVEIFAQSSRSQPLFCNRLSVFHSFS